MRNAENINQSVKPLSFQLMTKGEQQNLISTKAVSQTQSNTDKPKIDTIKPVNSEAGTTTTTNVNLNALGKANLFLQKEVIAGTKIKWLHVVLVAVAFVGYVELIADRKQKSKLKFW